MKDSYRETDKMFDVICDEFHLLQMVSRFGIPLGFGDRTVKEVCEHNGVDIQTFLALANFIKVGPEVTSYYVDKINVAALTKYLRQSHSYFLDFQLPNIRRTLVGAIDCSAKNQVAYLILKFFDEYMHDVRKHMEFENKKIFSYVHQLLDNKRQPNFTIRQFDKAHVGIDLKLQELKNLIIRYYRSDDPPEAINTVLFDIFTSEKDLREHCMIEDLLFIPAVEILETKIANLEPIINEEQEADPNNNELSEREKEIVRCIAQGLSNKEVAAKLFISVNTVLTHRKNIFRKLDIHSVSGLTIYAVVNDLITINDIKD